MKKENNILKAFIWNMIGSIVYSGASFLYLLVVTRFCGVAIAGFFSLSYATAQLLLQIGRYGMRTFQTTDLEQKYLFSEYAVSRMITWGLMVVFGIIYSGISFEEEYIIISCFVIFMKSIDAIEDVFHGNFQQNNQVEIMGKMLAVRNLFSIFIFTVVLFITRSLMITCVSTAIGSLIFCLFINGYSSKKQFNENVKKTREFSFVHVKELLKTCTPLFAGTFLSILLYNIPKYAMSHLMSDEYQTYYSILFMPTFMITLICEFLFKPIITIIAGLWLKKETKRFVLYVLRLMALVLVCSGVVVFGGHFLGRPILELIYGVDLSEYKLHFIILLVGGGVSSGVYIMYNILIAIRKAKGIVLAYFITSLLTLLVAERMVEMWGLMGAVLNFLFSCAVLFVFFLLTLIYVCLNAKENDEKKEETLTV